MIITLKERIVIRDSDVVSKSYTQILEAYSQTIGSYISSVVPRIEEVICVKKAEDTSPRFYDVVSVIHCYNDAHYNYHDDIHTISKHSYTVYVEVKEHVNNHNYKNNGYDFIEEWPLITTLKDISERQ